MNEIIYPRSPRETMDGWVHLPRLIDKIRLQKVGRLHKDYQPNYLERGFDLAWFQATGVDLEEFVKLIQSSITDGEICDWVKKNIKKSAAEKTAFGEDLLSYGTQGPLLEKLTQRKAESGFQDRNDIACMFDYIDADEERS